MITGEYLVLEGAVSLAIPLRFGQDLMITPIAEPILHWTAWEPGIKWFEATLSLPRLDVIYTTDPAVSGFLIKLLLSLRNLKSGFLESSIGYKIETHLNFNRLWGLGSSSTLISNLSRWAGVDPYELLWSVSKGSGYDVACATADGPILYQLVEGRPVVGGAPFDPPFKKTLYFAYLGKKQDSAASISEFRKQTQTIRSSIIEQVNTISKLMTTTMDAKVFRQCMSDHEEIIGDILRIPILNQSTFRDFPGIAKSLGAWGGDFALICSEAGTEEVRNQLKARKIKDFFTFDDIILKSRTQLSNE
jgi:hypothetical protein